MVERKLASIQKIIELTPIEGADKIEIATIKGWQCVVGKEEYKLGDLIVYCEIDSLLPEVPEFEFLRPGCFIDNGLMRGFRIKTRKFKGKYSQGLVLSLDVLKGKRYKHDLRENPTYEFKEGKDVSDLLNIIKYEKPIPTNLQGTIKGLFPSFLPKTDETRVQILKPLLEKYKGTTCYITEKLDGSSCTMFFNNGEFGVCSRNLELKKEDATYHETKRYFTRTDGKYQSLGEDGEPVGDILDTLHVVPIVSENVYWKMAREYDIENKLRAFGRNIALQGEVFGKGLQANPINVDFQKFLIFNIFDIDKQEYLNLIEMQVLCHTLNLDMVPILDTEFTLTDDIKSLVELSKGNSKYNKLKKREGIVIRPLANIIEPAFSEECVKGRISFKSINPEYLVDNDE
jgi:RNA ligase (TIGR02306 family)